jgi:hypothetical protein
MAVTTMPKLIRFGRGALRGFLSGSERSLYGNLPPGTDIAGASDRIGRRALAEQIAGTADHRSRKYKNARDYISRHLRGSRRSVKPEFQRKITDALRSDRRTEIKTRGTLQVDVTADVKVSRKVWRQGHMRAELRGAALRDYLDAVDRGNGNEAMSIFLDSYDPSGRMGRTVAEIPDIHDVRYTD